MIFIRQVCVGVIIFNIKGHTSPDLCANFTQEIRLSTPYMRSSSQFTAQRYEANLSGTVTFIYRPIELMINGLSNFSVVFQTICGNLT